MHITVDFPTKKLSGLKLTAFVLCSLIRFRQGKIGYGGRCRDSRGFLAEVMDISRRQVITLVAEMVEAGYVEEAEDKSLCTTAKWESLLEAGKALGCEKTSHLGVKKLHTPCEETSHNKEDNKLTHTGPESKNLQAPDPYEMIKQRLALAPRALKDKWTARGLTGDALQNLIETFATKEVAKLKGDAWEVAEEVERLCNMPNHWARLFTNAYANNYTPDRSTQATQAKQGVYVRPKINPNWS